VDRVVPVVHCDRAHRRQKMRVRIRRPQLPAERALLRKPSTDRRMLCWPFRGRGLSVVPVDFYTKGDFQRFTFRRPRKRSDLGDERKAARRDRDRRSPPLGKRETRSNPQCSTP
jgi:hypothetical protein